MEFTLCYWFFELNYHGYFYLFIFIPVTYFVDFYLAFDLILILLFLVFFGPSHSRHYHDLIWRLWRISCASSWGWLSNHLSGRAPASLSNVLLNCYLSLCYFSSLSCLFPVLFFLQWRCFVAFLFTERHLTCEYLRCSAFVKPLHALQSQYVDEAAQKKTKLRPAVL